MPTVRGRVVGLDGLRGIAALYVAAFHCWLSIFRGFPKNFGPGWLGWLMYGHLAVVFFLALSGFSLSLTPAGRGWRLGGLLRYAQRRAWRILPPYWAAVVFSLLVAWFVVPQFHVGPPTLRSVVVFPLLLQDFIPARSPNGAFWSIAVEAELYVAFPLLLLIRRRAGALVLLVAVTAPVIAMGLFVPGAPAADKPTGLTPQLAPLFAMGMVGAGLALGERTRRLPWAWLAALAAAPVLYLMVRNGSVWTANHYFWIDLALGPAIAMLLVAVATGRPAPLVWLLDTAPIRGLGRMSYSLYLIHLPIVVAISRRIVVPHVAGKLPEFWATVALALPASLVAAWLFARVFEIPFQRYRSWQLLSAELRHRYARLVPHETVSPEEPTAPTVLALSRNPTAP